MKSCGICSHTNRSDIDAALVDGASLRDIAGQYGTTKSALDRHRKHIPAALTLAKEASAVADSTSLLSRVEKLLSRCESICDRATAASHWSGAAAAARELRGCFELLGKLNGELQPNGAKVAINFGDITKVDIRQLSDEQLEALNQRLEVDRNVRIAGMSTEQIEAELVKIARDCDAKLFIHSEAILFDDVTVLPPSNIEACRRHDAMVAENYAKDGKVFQEQPWRTASQGDRFRMLQAAWKRETGKDLGATIEELGLYAVIEIEFDLAEGQYWERWPKVRLNHSRAPK